MVSIRFKVLFLFLEIFAGKMIERASLKIETIASIAGFAADCTLQQKMV